MALMSKSSRTFTTVLLLFFLAIPLPSCKYSITFSGVNLDPNVKSFSVETFNNEAMDGPANLGIQFTESLKEYYRRNTRLDQIVESGDLEFAGNIVRYDVSPVAAGAGELQNAQLQRLTIAIKVTFVNNFEDSKSFDKEFSFFADFDANQNLQQVEQRLIPEIFNQIILDIFNETVADW